MDLSTPKLCWYRSERWSVSFTWFARCSASSLRWRRLRGKSHSVRRSYGQLSLCSFSLSVVRFRSMVSSRRSPLTLSTGCESSLPPTGAWIVDRWKENFLTVYIVTHIDDCMHYTYRWLYLYVHTFAQCPVLLRFSIWTHTDKTYNCRGVFFLL